jgi:hypothetical protein
MPPPNQDASELRLVIHLDDEYNLLEYRRETKPYVESRMRALSVPRIAGPARLLPVVLLALLAGAGVARAQGAPPAPAAAPTLPTVPTTRILAIGRPTSRWSPEALRSVMPSEVRETVKLYLAGTISEWYVMKESRGVVFILNLTDTQAAHRVLEDLPLGRAGLMDFELIPLGPLSPLALLVETPVR